MSQALGSITIEQAKGRSSSHTSLTVLQSAMCKIATFQLLIPNFFPSVQKRNLKHKRKYLKKTNLFPFQNPKSVTSSAWYPKNRINECSLVLD